MSIRVKQEPEYISVNRRAYNALAEEYRARAERDRIKDAGIVAPFAEYLRGRFGHGARILDIGFGNGVNLAMLHDWRFVVHGIDISESMFKIAKATCPDAHLRLGNFLTAEYAPSSFEGVFSKASIHLFPKVDALRVIQKVANILVDDGMFYVTTTACPDSTEGYFRKDDYETASVRYRKHWTRKELIDAVTAVGFTIYSECYNDEPSWGKRWFNVWAVKPSSSLPR